MQLVIEGSEADAEGLGGGGLVAAVSAQGLLDHEPFDLGDGSFGDEGGGLFGFGDEKAEVFGLDVGLIAEDFSSFDDISEFADVSRPGVEGHGVHGGR